MAIFRDKRIILSLVLGALVVVVGLVAVISSLGVSFPLPAFLTDVFTMKILLVLAGLMLVYDSFKADVGLKKLLFIMAGVVLFALGLLPLLLDFNLLGFLPFALDLTISPIILETVLVAYGVYLLVNAFKIMGYYKMQ